MPATENEAESIRDQHRPAYIRHAVFRALVGLAVVVAGIFIYRFRDEWHGSIHDGLLADWNLGGFTPFVLAMSTIIASRSRTWQGTAMACLGSLMAALQYEMAAIAAALLMSHWYPFTPDGAFFRASPALFGVAIAFPVMLGTVILITRQAGRPRGIESAKVGGAGGAQNSTRSEFDGLRHHVLMSAAG